MKPFFVPSCLVFYLSLLLDKFPLWFFYDFPVPYISFKTIVNNILKTATK